MKKLLLLLLFVFHDDAEALPFEIKNTEQFALGAMCTVVGLTGAGLTVKLVREWLGQRTQKLQLKKDINAKGATIREWHISHPNPELYVHLEYLKKDYSLDDMTMITNSWNAMTKLRSEQRSTETLLKYSATCSCFFLWIGPSIMRNQIKRI